MDPDLLSFYRNGEDDMHSFIASKLFPVLNGLTLPEIKEKYPDLRQTAKSAGFAIAYGGNGFTISVNIGVSQEQGEQLYEAYFKGFPGLKKYYSNLIKDTLARGYIIIDQLTGRRRGFHKPKDKKEESAIGRKCLNSPVQGTAGSITKLAIIYLYKKIKELGLTDVIKITNAIHDEIILEVLNTPNTTKVGVKILEEAMIKAGKPYCKTIPLTAEAVVTPYWHH